MVLWRKILLTKNLLQRQLRTYRYKTNSSVAKLYICFICININLLIAVTFFGYYVFLH